MPDQAESSFMKTSSKSKRSDTAILLKSGLSALEIANLVNSRFELAVNYANTRRNSWRAGSSLVHWTTLGASAAATIVLGLSNLGTLGSIGFILSALVTTISAIEPFFNWRSRWVMAEEALADWYRGQQELELYISSTPEEAIDLTVIHSFDTARDATWRRFSKQWIAERRSGARR